MFEHVKVNLGYDDLKTVTTEDYRVYVEPEQQRALPSITTVLSANPNKAQILEDWKERIGEDEAKKISVRAAKHGTAVHDMIEQYLRNNPLYRKGHMPTTYEAFMKVKAVLDQDIGKVYGLEIPLYSLHLGVAGRVDCVADFQGKRSIIDFKTSRRMKRKSWIEAYFMQEAAYSIMWEERTTLPIEQLVTLIAVEEGNHPCQIFIEHRDDWAPSLLEAIKYFRTTDYAQRIPKQIN